MKDLTPEEALEIRKQKRIERQRNSAYKSLNRGPSLCWKCANSVPSSKRETGCEWSNNFKPVPGWVAKECKLQIYRGHDLQSYHVIECPKFVPFALKFRPGV